MAEESVGDRLLDAVVYVPVGLMVSLAEELPALAEKGRQRVGNQLQVARVIGRMAVAEGRRRFASAAPTPGPVDQEAGSEPASMAARHPEARSRRPERAGASRDGSGERLPSAPPAPPEDVPGVATLAIPGYDTLAASQVVQRLATLRPEELEAIRRYEAATRGRRTILQRIGQLTMPDGRASA